MFYGGFYMRDTGKKSSVPSHLPYVPATVAEVAIVLKALLKVYKLMIKNKCFLRTWYYKL